MVSCNVETKILNPSVFPTKSQVCVYHTVMLIWKSDPSAIFPSLYLLENSWRKKISNVWYDRPIQFYNCIICTILYHRINQNLLIIVSFCFMRFLFKINNVCTSLYRGRNEIFNISHLFLLVHFVLHSALRCFSFPGVYLHVSLKE